MDSILYFLLSNALVATILAFALVLVGALWRQPRLLHMLWVIVLVKLVTPPIVTVPIPCVLEIAESQTTSRHQGPVESAPQDEVTALAAQEIGFTEAPTDQEVASNAAPFSAPSATSRLTSSLDEMLLQIGSVSLKTWLILLWLSGSVICLGVTVSRIVAFRQLLKRSSPADESVLQHVGLLSRLLGLKKRPLIVMLSGRISPVVWHMSRRITVVLPEQLFRRLDDECRQTVLAHELAHIVRRDHWVRLLEVFATFLFWWHPLLWWARRRLHEFEEQCCDIEVLRVLPNSARSYANALVDTVEFMRGPHVLPATATGMRPTSLLKRRIEMVVRAESVGTFSLFHGAVVGLIALTVLPLAIVGQSDDLRADQEVRDALIAETDGNGGRQVLSPEASALELADLSTVPIAGGTQDSDELRDPILTLVDQAVLAVDEAFDDWDTRPDVEVGVDQFVAAFAESFGLRRTRSIYDEADENGDRRVNRDEARRFLEIQFAVRRSDGKLLREPGGCVYNFVHFLNVDANRDDRLDRDEFLQRSKGEAKASELVDLFDRKDTDGDKALSFDEWRCLPRRAVLDPVNEFRRMDKNLDARLDPKELAAGAREWHKVLVESVFPAFDQDRDGVLTLFEYRLTMLANPVLPWNRIIRDPDGDGELSFSEFTFDKLQFPLLRWIYFQRLDTDGDGILVPEEFHFKIKWPDRFFVMNEDGTGWRLLFQFEGYPACGSPAVSPDGKLIAFDAWSINPRTSSATFVMSIDGGNPRKLGSGMMPNWSNDGKRLTYSWNGLRIIDAEGSEQEVLRQDGWGAQWSPDGKKIAFYEGKDMKTYDVETKTPQTILASDAHDYSRLFWNMTWSPDSQRLCFKAIKADGAMEVASVNTTGDEPDLKVHHSGKTTVIADLAWHPDGNRVVFAMFCRERDRMQLYEFNPDTDDPPVLVDGQDEAGNNSDVCWTPDGKRLIVVSGNF